MRLGVISSLSLTYLQLNIININNYWNIYKCLLITFVKQNCTKHAANDMVAMIAR